MAKKKQEDGFIFHGINRRVLEGKFVDNGNGVTAKGTLFADAAKPKNIHITGTVKVEGSDKSGFDGLFEETTSEKYRRKQALQLIDFFKQNYIEWAKDFPKDKNMVYHTGDFLLAVGKVLAFCLKPNIKDKKNRETELALYLELIKRSFEDATFIRANGDLVE